MGQVPFMAEVFTSYLIVGGGRVARHFARYFELASIPHQIWTRKEDVAALRARAEGSSHVLLLISDGAIEGFYRAHSFLHGKTVVHCSGSLASDLVPGAHPLMTFADELYGLDTYRNIPFIVEKDRDPRELLPKLSNPIHFIDKGDKGLYHALCAMSGNFTVLLWEKAFREFETRLGIPRSALLPYLERVAKNLAQVPPGQSVLTGPLARGDRAVIERHLQQLEDDPYEGVYRAFVAAFERERR